MREYRPENRDKLHQYDKNWYARNVERVRAYNTAYRISNLDTLRAKDLAYRAENIDRIRAYDRERAKTEHRKAQLKRTRANTLPRILAANAARKSRMRGLPTEKVDRLAIFDRDGGKCHICGGRADRNAFHLDHLIPVVDGGGFVAANLRVSHPSCNMSRGPGRIDAQLLLIG
jgi:5-methylcytosine-specific restriction endonuclease McrA